MPRPRSFDPDDVLDRVTAAFWARGYANTTIADLEAASGLGRQSLYGTFGDKHALFLRALDRYVEQGATARADAGAGGATGLARLRAYLVTMAAMLTGGEVPAKCMVVDSVLEFGDSDADVAARCRAGMRGIEGIVRQALREASEAGELREGIALATATRLVTTQVYGFSVTARAGATRAQLTESIDLLLRALQP